MTWKFLGRLAISFAALFPAVEQAQSITLISNYPSANTTGGTTIGFDQTKAAGFTIGAGTSYSLDSVTMRFNVTTGGATPAATLAINLFGGSAANPAGPALVSFVVPTFTTVGSADYTFAPSSALTLIAGSTYWLATRSTSPSSAGQVDWVAGSAPTGIATSAGYRISTDNTYPPTNPSTTLNLYSVQATAINPAAPVPEPATWALMLVGFGAVGYTARRRPKVTARVRRAA